MGYYFRDYVEDEGYDPENPEEVKKCLLELTNKSIKILEDYYKHFEGTKMGDLTWYAFEHILDQIPRYDDHESD